MKIRSFAALAGAVTMLAGCAGMQRALPETPATPQALEQLQQVRDQHAAGHYGEVVRQVAKSDELAGSTRAVRVEAYKLQAFSHCVTRYTQLCVDSFARILALDPRSSWHPMKQATRPGDRPSSAPGSRPDAKARAPRIPSAQKPARKQKGRRFASAAFLVSGLPAPDRARGVVRRLRLFGGVLGAQIGDRASASEPTVTGASSNGLASWRAASRSAASSASLSLRAWWYARPVPAGIRRPTMTFSFAAQVVALAHDGGLGQDPGGFRNEAAEMNESVDSEALVMPSSTLSYEAGRLPSASTRSFSFSSSERSTCSPGMNSVSPASTMFTRRSI